MRLTPVLFSVFVTLALVSVARASQAHVLYLPQIMSDAPRIVSALGPCGAPLECIQAPAGYP